MVKFKFIVLKKVIISPIFLDFFNSISTIMLSATGGIVQGMSGSPIIQDGKLIGAVTHVLVDDPTTGYGIFIENMLSAAA